jgi:predicted DNA-binding transcriptional regulator AlpA
MAAGTFPKSVKLGPQARAIAFVENEVDAWIAERIAEREAA